MTSPYRKLTGRRRSLTGFTQAWMADDHLLIVDSTRFVERYRRFAFSDIQAIVVADLSSRWLLQVVAVLISLFWMLYSLQAESLFAKYFFAITGMIALAFAIRDVLRGTRCRCVLQTAVSREVLRPVSRVAVARKFLAAISPAIEAAQASLAQPDARQQAAVPPIPVTVPFTESGEVAVATEPAPVEPELSSIPARPPSFSSVEPPPSIPGALTPGQQPPPIIRPRGHLPEILFGLLFVDAILVSFSLRSFANIALGALSTVYLAEIVLGIGAVIQTRSRSAICLGLAIAAILGTIVDASVLSGPAGFAEFVRVLIDAIQRNITNPGGAVVLHTPVQTIVESAGWRIAVSLLGLAACFVDRRENRIGEPR